MFLIVNSEVFVSIEGVYDLKLKLTSNLLACTVERRGAYIDLNLQLLLLENPLNAAI